MPETHSPARPNTFKVRAGRTLIGIGAVGFAYLAHEQSIEPPVATIEAATSVDALTLGPPRDLDNFVITQEPRKLPKREPKVSRSKERVEPEAVAECWDAKLSDFDHIPKEFAKKALANIALACEIAADEPWFSEEQTKCLDILWDHESGWNHRAGNDSGAYGIPQALPGSKMKSAGKDWLTDPATQIRWGIGYINDRYKTPCGALSAWQSKGWY